MLSPSARSYNNKKNIYWLFGQLRRLLNNNLYKNIPNLLRKNTKKSTEVDSIDIMI